MCKVQANCTMDTKEKKMELAKDEKLIRKWLCSQGVNLAGKTHSWLTLTNKRLISTVCCNNQKTRQEIAIKDVKGIASGQGTPIKWITYLMMGLGVLLWLIGLFVLVDSCLYGWVIKTKWLEIFLYVITGSFWVGIAMLRLQSGWVRIVIRVTGMEGKPFSCGAIGLFSGGLNNKGGLTIKVNNRVAEEIVDTLGAIILDNRQ